MLLDECEKELDVAVKDMGWETIISKCPVRESGALDRITKALGFSNVSAYERAVRKLLEDDAGTLEFVRSLFKDLYEQLNA